MSDGDSQQKPCISGQGSQLREMRVVKTECVEEPTTMEAASVGGDQGYEEEPEVGDMVEQEHQGSSAVNAADVLSSSESASQSCSSRELFDMSPLDKRLREKRGFNEGNWTSQELKWLYDGIILYGTSDDALEFIQRSYCSTKSFEEVLSKVNEIRAINLEHREERMRAEGERWLEAGYQNVRADPKYVSLPEVNNWEAALQRVNRQLRSQSDHTVRTAMEDALLTTENDEANPKVYKVTDYCHSRSYGKEQTISWQRLGAFFAGVIRHVRPLPPLNPLECAVALRIVDDVEEEVSRELTDEDKAIIRGWLANIQMRQLEDFLPDVPYSVDNAAQVLLDPLRTRLWDIPEQGCDIPIDAIDVELGDHSPGSVYFSMFSPSTHQVQPTFRLWEA
ncbi:hypothetical protein Q1695_008735 [Nippostrongylus brasiliensis]|nr:hypothetical protein Q1695_008735 [Nippostrongylus brasiliensis]